MGDVLLFLFSLGFAHSFEPIFFAIIDSYDTCLYLNLRSLALLFDDSLPKAAGCGLCSSTRECCIRISFLRSSL